MLRLRVSDTGLGVPEAVVPHLFLPYGQASRWRFGTGLGLYHVSELAKALGGVAQHAHNAPSGAVFWVDVPYVPVDNKNPPTVPASHHASHEPRVESSKPAEVSAPVASAPRLVLVVDDDDVMRETHSMLIEAIDGYAVESAADGEDGLQKLTSGEAFILALIDLQMPFKDGFETVRGLRAWEAKQGAATRRLRAIAISANGDDPGIAKECLAAGFDGLSSKPLTVTKLEELLVAESTDKMRE